MLANPLWASKDEPVVFAKSLCSSMYVRDHANAMFACPERPWIESRSGGTLNIALRPLWPGQKEVGTFQ